MNPDVVHAHNYHSFPLLFAAVAAHDARFIATPHYHGGSASSFRDRLLSIYRPIGGWALHNADEVIAVSDWEQSQLENDFAIDVTVIPNGVDIDRFRKAEPRTWKRPYLLTVGRLEEYKGVQHVIRALPNLPEYDLLVAGSGPYRDELERIAEAINVSDQISFLGYVPDDELPGLYAGAEVHIALSSFEAYGLTVAEALAAETPCVVHKQAALADWDKYDGCVSISNRSESSIATAVWTASDFTQVADPPNWEDVVDEVERIYD
jgi:glycosyltransferase involved in cell wall biosynthesis